MVSTPARQDDGSLRSGRITIDLDAIADNWRTLSAKLKTGAECAAVVKADAYGLGIAEVAVALHAAGARTFFVATPEEGLALRALLSDAVIYILNGLYPNAAADYAAANLRPVIGSTSEAAVWSDFIRSAGIASPAALHVDTGMNRLGLTIDEARSLSQDDRSGFAPVLVISHLACADTPSHPMNAEQLVRFRTLKKLFPGSAMSFANSAGILLGQDYHFDLARPGIALYGARASTSGETPLRPVAKVEARLLMTRHVRKGETVGYGASYTAERDMRIGLVAVGYADGLLRLAGATDDRPGAFMSIGGRKVPILGRVTMDQTMISLESIAEDEAAPGRMVEVFGPDIAVDDVAASAETIGYELLTRLGQRLERRYIGGRHGLGD
ncbi:alanine racemase [Stappia sp. F7233]|uniref:Alanine racemase n=1 Tax=Stappia albiluteola TaxID=2758565 RepID=A0A839ACI3_9HYPH|nr:alanine racemase [Stappia albiluteola]MBA5776825.1 alanine racemase [Stappia albiluteola]